MSTFRTLWKRAGAPFAKGGPLARWHALYEGVDTFLYTPAYTTATGPHVRDALDMKRVMGIVVFALLPCIVMAMYNTGYQAHLTVEQGGQLLPVWQTAVYGLTGLPVSSASVIGCLTHGALYFIPVYLVVFATGAVCEIAFALVRGHELNEGFFVTGTLIPLILPATIPYWQVVLGTAFGVVVGKEIFGGTGMNFLNPALTTRAFLFFAYPAQISGDVWVAATAPDGVSGATWLASWAEGSGHLPGLSWTDAFVGLIPGSMGETSTLAVLIGAAILLITRIAAWQTMFGVVLGTLVAAFGLNALGSDTNPMMSLPFHWHVVLGGWAFGAVFMATDPVSSAFTNTGKHAYGFGIGVLCVLIRVVNPAYPEGMMLAILFMNMFAPLIDHVVIQRNVKRRAARRVQRSS